MSDSISRHSAISAIQKAYVDTNGGENRNAVRINVGLTKALHILQDLPSADSKCIPVNDACSIDENIPLRKGDK